MALLTLGGALKRKEMLSARFGDILSELYLLSAALKRWQDEGRQQADFAALEWCMASGFRTIENRFAEILANLPNRFVAVILKFLIQPFGARVTGPSDRVVHQCAQLVLEPSAARDRLTADLSQSTTMAASPGWKRRSCWSRRRKIFPNRCAPRACMTGKRR